MPESYEDVILRVEQLTAGFKAGWWTDSAKVLENISFEVRRGEAVGFVGRSGVGKTTLALTCAGLLRPLKGVVQRLVRTDGSEPDVRSQIDVLMVFQNPFAALNPRRTVRQFLRFVAKRSRSIPLVGEEPEYSLRNVGLAADVLGRRPGELSGGECQRVCIAAALIAKSRILILDEPTSMLDSIARRQFIDAVCRVRADFGISLLVFSHDLDLISEVCDRVLVLADARVVEAGPVRKIFEFPMHLETRALITAYYRLST